MAIRHFRGVLALSMLAAAGVSADTEIQVYQDSNFDAKAVLSSCTSACLQQMAVVTQYRFLYNGDYNTLYSLIDSIGIRATAYDSEWQDAESGELLFKLSSTVHQRQRWQRTVRGQRKPQKVADMANAIYATATAGQTVTLEFLQDATPLVGSDFTVNVRRFEGDTLVSSGSTAVGPSPSGGSPGETAER